MRTISALELHGGSHELPILFSRIRGSWYSKLRFAHCIAKLFLAMSKLLEQLTNVKSFYIENCALFVVLHYTYLLPEPQ